MTLPLAAQIEAALRDAAGADTQPSSLTIDYGAEGELTDLEVRAWVERTTRSLVFAQLEVRRRNGTLAAAASAVFRRLEA